MTAHFRHQTPPLPTENIVLMHDNARPHKAFIVQNWLRANVITTLPQPPYLPDLNLLDRYVFRNLEMFRRGVDFADLNTLNAIVSQFMTSRTKAEFLKQMDNLAKDA